MRTCARVIKTIVALAGLLLLIGAVPVALVIVVGWPLPDHWPTAAEWTTWASSDTLLTTHTLIDGAACLLWVGWLCFVSYLGLEVLRGLREIRLPHLRVPTRRQGWVGGMVGAIVLGASHAAAAHAGSDHHSTTTPAAIQTAAPDDDPDQRSYTVRSGDTLWDIAAREDGDPLKYKDIAAANSGRTSPTAAGSPTRT